MPNPRAQKNPSFFLPEALQGLADMGRGAVRGALAEGLGTAGDITQALQNIKTAGFMPAMLARGLQGPTSEEMSHALRGMTPNPLTQPDRAHTARMGQTFGSIPVGAAAGAGTNAAAQKAMAKLNSMQKVESMMPKAPKPVAEILKGPEPDFMRVYSGQRIPIEGKYDIMRADPHASMGRAFYTAELPRYANKFTGNQPGANVTPVDVDRNRMLMFDKMYDTPQGQMEGLDYYDMLRRQAMAKPGIGKDMIRQEILDAGFAGTQMPNATGKAYAIYDTSAAQDMSGRGFANGGMVSGRHNDDGNGAMGVDSWRADNASGGLVQGMAAGGLPYKGINPMATGLGSMLQQSMARNAASNTMAQVRQARFANQAADRLARQNQLAAAKTARFNALAPKLSTYVPPAGSTAAPASDSTGAVTDAGGTTNTTTVLDPGNQADMDAIRNAGARGGLVKMSGGGLGKKAAEKAFKALPGQSFQGKSGLSALSPDEEARRLIAKMDQPSVEDVLKVIEEPKPVTAAQRAAAGRAAAKQIATTQVQRLSDVLGNLNIEGKGSIGVGQSDRTRVGGGNIGGAHFPGIQHADPLYEGMGWGVGNVPTASNLISNFASPRKYFTTLLGSEHQLKTNPVVFERLKKGFMQAMKEGKLQPELEAKINHNLALTFGEGADIRDPRIWKKANTFEKRAALGDIMLGRGIPPKKGGVALGGEKSGKGVIFNPSDILREETEKMLLHPEHGGNVPTYAVGPRLVQFSGDYSIRPDLHPGFPVLLHGKDMNVVFNPVPGEIALPDFVAELAKPSEKFPKGKKPGYYEWTMGLPGKGLPSQPITEEYLRHLQREGFKKGGKVKKMQAGGMAKAVKSGLQALEKPAKQTITSAIDPTTDIASRLTQPDRINLLPMPSRWFLDPKNNPGVQKLVEKVLDVNNMKRSDFYSGAFVNPRTGEVMDKKVMQDVGVLINPATGRPMMSAEKEVDITIGDRNKGSKTKSNLVRKQLYETEGDPILKDLDFLVAIEQSGMGHKYGLATEYATPAEMFNTMTGDNPTLRPMSRGDVFGIGDIVGRMAMKSSKMPHDVYESLLIAPKGSDVQGVKLSKKHGGRVKGRK